MKNKFLYAILGIFGGSLFGYDTAVINGAMPFFTSHFELNDALVGWAVSSGLIGCIVGAASSGWFSSKYGRKISLFYIAGMFLISALLCAFAPTFTFFVIARMVGGLAVGGVSVILPIYLSEMSASENRGRMTINFQLGVVIGILTAFFADYLLLNTGENNWRYMFLSMSIPALVFGISLLFVDKSPRWLISVNQEDKAYAVLRKTMSHEISVNFIEDVKASFKMERYSVNFSSLFRSPYLKFILIGMAIGGFSQLTGIAVVMYYATDIFRDAGFSTDAALGQTVIVGATNLIFTLLAKYLIDKIGRRKLLLFGIIGMSLFLFLMGLSSMGVISYPISSLIFLVAFVALFACSMGAVSWVLLSEIYPNEIRAQGMSLGSLSNWTINATCCFLFPIIVGKFANGDTYCFMFFAVMTFIGFFLFKKYLFETNNKSLEQISNENN